MKSLVGIFFLVCQFLFWGLFQKLQSRRWALQSKKYINKLDRIEKVPLLWPLNGAIPEPIAAILPQVEAFLRDGESLPATKWLSEVRMELLRRYLALQYRLERRGERFSEEHYRIIHSIALKWYLDHPLHNRTSVPHLVDEQLRLAANFPSFIELLLTYPSLKASFLTWTLQDRNPVEPFIEYPSMQELLVSCNLAGRLQRAYPSALRILTSGNQKYLAMMIEGRYVNILEMDEVVVIKGSWKLSIKDIFNIFRNKTYHVGDLEFFTTGVTNWNAHKMAWWNNAEKKYIPIDVSAPNWWMELPILQVMTRSEARQHFGFAVDGKHWIAAATATRGTATLDYDQSHAYLEVSIPMRDGRYAVYDFGKFATVYPKNMFDALLLFTNSVHATIAYPDENAYYTHRQHAQHAFALAPNEAETLMDLIRRDILKGRDKNFVYQIESENCAKWVQTILQDVLGIEKVPNMFIMPLIEAEPQGPVDGLFKLLKMMPNDLPSRILVKLHFPLGAWRGNWVEEGGKKVWKALTTHPFWHSGLVYLPAFLHKQRSQGDLYIINGGRQGVLLRKYHLSQDIHTGNQDYPRAMQGCPVSAAAAENSSLIQEFADNPSNLCRPIWSPPSPALSKDIPKIPPRASPNLTPASSVAPPILQQTSWSTNRLLLFLIASYSESKRNFINVIHRISAANKRSLLSSRPLS